MTDPIMVDCIAADVPAVKGSRWANHPAQAYVTGGWPVEWSNAQIAQFARHIRTAQQPASFANDGSDARELDVERFAAAPADWPEFWHSRTRKDQATCYCSLSVVGSVIDACVAANVPLPPRWRLAWWWKNAPGVPLPDDDIPAAPAMTQVLGELHRLYGLTLDPDTVWGCQFANYRFWDLSVIYGAADFART